MKADPGSFLPLSPAALHILLALAPNDLHGYGIMQEIVRQSDGRYKLGPGTLYDNLQRLLAQRVVEEVTRGPRDQDSRRRYYRLTSLGQHVLSAESVRLEGVIRLARLHLENPKPRRV